MSSVTTLLYQFLKKRFGNFDWGNGSVIRALVAEPVVELSEQAVSAINNVYTSLDIRALLDAPEEHIEDIDNLFDSLGLSIPTATISTGSVRLLLSSGASFGIPVGATFAYGDITLVTTDTYNVVTSPTLSNDLGIQQVGADAYEVLVPVSSAATGVNLSEGAELTWAGITADIYSASVYSTITGGINDYTATQKINLIRQQLFPEAVTAQEGVLRAINAATPDLAVDCAFATTSPIGTTDIYVKTTAAPSTWQIEATATRVDDKYKVSIPLSGVARVNRAIVAGTSYPIASTVRTARYLEITFIAENSGDAIAVTVEVFGLSTMPQVQDALDRYTANTGIQLIAQVPELLSLAIYAPISSGVITNDAITAVVAAINTSRLNATGIGDSGIHALLVDQGVTTTGSSTYTVSRYLGGSTKSNLGTTDASLLISGVKPYALYSHNNQVTFADV